MFKLENLKFLVKYNWHDYFNKMTLNYDKCKLNKGILYPDNLFVFIQLVPMENNFLRRFF